MKSSEEGHAKLDPKIVLLAQSGDHESIGLLIDYIQRPLFCYIRRYLKDQTQAEEVLQEVLLQIFRKLTSLNDPQLFKAWAYQIATRSCFKKTKTSVVFEEMSEETVSPNRQDLDSKIDLHKALAEISTSGQAVLSLHYLEGFSLDEVAAILDIPLGTVKSRLNYGLHQMRKKLS